MARELSGADRESISRRRFIAQSAAAGVSLSLLGRGVSEAAENEKQRPNVLFVMSDQWRRQALSFMNADPCRTPRVDRFAHEARWFDQALAATPVCGPNRACMFSGQYMANHGVVGNDLPLPTTGQTLGDCLKRAGYQTGYIGKWHLEPEPGGRSAFIPPGEHWHGFDYWYRSCWHRPFANGYYEGDNPEQIVARDQWAPTHETDKAIDYIRRHRQDPWALVVSYGPPHTGGGPGFEDRWMPGKPPTKENGYGYAAPERWEAPYRPPEDVAMPPNFQEQVDGEPVRHCIPGYFGACDSIDHEFGRLLDTLDELGLKDNTVVVFTSDHGEMMGSHGRLTKGVWYEESAGVPLLIRWPGRIEPGRDSTLFNSVDLMPTLLGLADVETPNLCDGTDLAPHLLGREMRLPELAHLSFRDGSSKHLGRREWRAVRTDRYCYVMGQVKRYHRRGKEVGPDGRVLYDLRNDPYQMEPIFTGMGQDRRMRELETVLREQIDRTGDPFFREVFDA